MNNKDYMDKIDTMDFKAKKDKDKIHNLKLSTPTFDKFHQIRNELTFKLGKTRIENDIFLWKLLYFIEKNKEDFVISYEEDLTNEE